MYDMNILGFFTFQGHSEEEVRTEFAIAGSAIADSI